MTNILCAVTGAALTVLTVVLFAVAPFTFIAFLLVLALSNALLKVKAS